MAADAGVPESGQDPQSCQLQMGVFKSWGYSGGHALELLEKSSYVLLGWALLIALCTREASP